MSAVIGVPNRTHISKENACKRHVADIITLSGTSSSFFFPLLSSLLLQRWVVRDGA